MIDWDAVVLAGGRGSRLGGVDKSFLEFEGETLLARTLAAVSAAKRVVVVGDVEASGAVVVRENPPGGGPAAAVGAALDHLTSDYVVLVGCDQPFVSEALPHLLAAVVGDGVVAVDATGRRQYLMSVLRLEALRASAADLGPLDGLPLRVLLAPVELSEVSVPERSTLDIDTWDDEARARVEEARDD